jgi:hypothetical protein
MHRVRAGWPSAGSDIHVMLTLRHSAGQVIVADERFDGPNRIAELLGARQRLAHHAGDTLTQRVVEPLNVIALARQFPDGPALRGGNHPFVSDVLIRVNCRMLPIGRRHLRPSPLGTASAAIPTWKAITWRLVASMAIPIHDWLAFLFTQLAIASAATSKRWIITLCWQVTGRTWRWSGKPLKHTTRKPNSHFSVTPRAHRCRARLSAPPASVRSALGGHPRQGMVRSHRQMGVHNPCRDRSAGQWGCARFSGTCVSGTGGTGTFVPCFLQTPPHEAAFALRLAFGSADTWHEDLHLARAVPGLAHTPTLGRGWNTCVRRHSPGLHGSSGISASTRFARRASDSCQPR